MRKVLTAIQCCIIMEQSQQHSAGRYATPEGCRVQGVIRVLLVFIQTTRVWTWNIHVSIEINGVKLEVIGNYWPGEAASWDSPGNRESVEIEKS